MNMESLLELCGELWSSALHELSNATATIAQNAGLMDDLTGMYESKGLMQRLGLAKTSDHTLKLKGCTKKIGDQTGRISELLDDLTLVSKILTLPSKPGDAGRYATLAARLWRARAGKRLCGLNLGNFEDAARPGVSPAVWLALWAGGVRALFCSCDKEGGSLTLSFDGRAAEFAFTDAEGRPRGGTDTGQALLDGLLAGEPGLRVAQREQGGFFIVIETS